MRQKASSRKKSSGAESSRHLSISSSKAVNQCYRAPAGMLRVTGSACCSMDSHVASSTVWSAGRAWAGACMVGSGPSPQQRHALLMLTRMWHRLQTRWFADRSQAVSGVRSVMVGRWTFFTCLRTESLVAQEEAPHSMGQENRWHRIVVVGGGGKEVEEVEGVAWLGV